MIIKHLNLRRYRLITTKEKGRYLMARCIQVTEVHIGKIYYAAPPFQIATVSGTNFTQWLKGKKGLKLLVE